MPAPDGYLLSESDVRILKRLVKSFDHLQHYVNAFGREPEDKLDHEEFNATGTYIARSPSSGIPALMSAGSTGIGDTPGSANCQLFKKNRGSATTDQLYSGITKKIYNLSETSIAGDTWVIVVRDQHGQYFAVQPGIASTGGGSGGPGWVAGLSNEDCLELTVIARSGRCSNISLTQDLLLASSDGVTWTSTTNFVYSGASGPAVFTRPCAESMPKLTIGGYCLIWEAAGQDVDGNYYIDFKGGTDLCSDHPGTGSGTGGAFGLCGTNTFTVRLKCVDAYYCISDSGGCTGDSSIREVLQLTSPEVAGLKRRICYGPFLTYDEALLVCGIPCGTPIWCGYTLKFTNKTGTCSCLPDFPAVHSCDSVQITWGTNTCPGNLEYQFTCVNGLFTFLAGGTPCILLSYTSSPFKIVYQLPDLSPNCSGTARAEIT